jgi:hypothetical protein
MPYETRRFCFATKGVADPGPTSSTYAPSAVAGCWNRFNRHQVDKKRVDEGNVEKEKNNILVIHVVSLKLNNVALKTCNIFGRNAVLCTEFEDLT